MSWRRRLAWRNVVPHNPAAAVSSGTDRDGESLSEAITRFNLFPALYWHDSWRAWLTARIGPIESQLDAQPFWIREMSTAILRGQGLEEQFDFDFADPVKRLALLDAPTLHRLCLALAGLLVRQHLRLLVSRDDARLIQRCLGQDVHKLVLEWHGPLPIATSAPLWSADWRSHWVDSDAWARRGVATLYSAVSPASHALHGRFRMKFPMEWPDDSFAVHSAPEHRQFNANIILKLLSLLAPGWSWLFAENVVATEVAA
jgi:hypothetical protein